MNVVIAGGGSVGRFIAEQLVGRAATRSSSSSRRRGRVGEPRTGRARRESPGWRATRCEIGELAEAGARPADVVAAVTGDDEDNLVISLLAKQEFGVPRVVARVNNPKNEWMFNEMWGVDVSVSTPHLLTAPRRRKPSLSARSSACCRSRVAGRARRGHPRRGLAGRRQGDRRARLPPRRHRGRHPPQGPRDRPAGRHRAARRRRGRRAGDRRIGRRRAPNPDRLTPSPLLVSGRAGCTPDSA